MSESLSVLFYFLPIPILLLNFSAKENRKLIFIIVFIIVFFTLGFRKDLGFDFDNYKSLIVNGYQFREPISNVLANIAHEFDLPLLFFSINALVTIFCITYVSIKEDEPWIFLAYICLPWFYVESFSIVRQATSLSIAIVMYMFVVKGLSNRSIYLLGGLSICFHYSAIVFVGFLLLSKVIMKIRSTIYFSGLFFFVLIFPYLYEMIIKVFPILNFYQSGTSFGLSALILYCFLSMFIWDRNRYSVSNRVLFFGGTLYILSITIDSSLSRVAFYFAIPLLWNDFSRLFGKTIEIRKINLVFGVFLYVSLASYSLYLKGLYEKGDLIPYNSYLGGLF